MELINGRYRVIKHVKQHKLTSTYLVVDMLNNHRTIELNMLNSEYFPESLLKFYAREFVNLANIDTCGIAKVYDFSLVKLMDNKKLDTNQYYYTSDSINTEYKLLHTLRNIDDKILLDIFVDLMQTVNYLHLRGMAYGEINLDNAYLVNNDDGYRIILKDLATIEYKKYDYWTSKNDMLLYKAPEVMAGQIVSAASDIYSLGVLFVTLIGKEDKNSIDLYEKVKEIKVSAKKRLSVSRSHFEFVDKLIGILEKMLEANVENRYKSIVEIVEDINGKFNTNFSAYKKEERERVNINTKLIGREYEVNNIVNIYNAMLKNQSDKKIIFLHGEHGVGKTKLLKEAERIMLLKNIRVYSSFSFNSAYGDKAYLEILKKVISECDEEILERYQSDIMKIIPEIGELKKIIPVEPLSGQRERNRLLNSVIGLITDFLENKPTVFIIDNLHLSNEFTINVLEHLFVRNKNIVLLVSYCDGEIEENESFSKLLSKFNGRNYALDMPIHGLSIDESSTLIKNILCMAKKPMKFATKVYSKTYGNPLFIEETIKDFVSQKILYLDDKTGLWNSDHYNQFYEGLPLPVNMQQAVMNQIKGIDDQSYEILRVLSIFNSGVFIENLVELLNQNVEVIENLTKGLENKGILCKKIEDRGFVFDFCNRVLKNIIRDELSEDYKRLKHKEAAAILERQYEEGREYREELILHLEEAGEKEKVIRYCLENADKMEAFKNRREAIKNLEKALSMLGEDCVDERSIKLINRTGELYESEGSIAVAIKYYERAEKLAGKALDYKLQIDCLNKIAGAYHVKNEIKNAEKYIKKVEKILNKNGSENYYLEGYLESKRIQANVFVVKLENEKAEEICKKCIALCGDNFNKMKGLFYNSLGNSYMNSSKAELSLQCYNNGIKCFEVDNYIKGTVMCLNNIAVIYGDFYQDNEKCISYLLKMKDLSEKNQIINNEIFALFNLGCSYIYEWKYDSAFEYFNEALMKAKDIEYESSIFICYCYILGVNLKLYNYDDAYSNYLNVERELEMYPDHGADISNYYSSTAEMFMHYGEYDRANEFVNKFMERNYDDIYLPKWDLLLLWNQHRLIYENNKENVDIYIEEIKNVLSNYKDSRVKINALYDMTIELLNKNLMDEAEKIYREAQSLSFENVPELIQTKKTYLKGIFDSGKRKLSLLTEALEMAKKTGEKNLQYLIYEAIGDLYFLKKNYFYAVNYYFEACEVIKNLAVQIPDDFKLNFINNKGLLSPFIKLMRMKVYNNAAEVGNHFSKVESLKQLNSLFDYEEFKDILTNKFFIKSARKIYSSGISKKLKDIKDVMKNLNSDSLKNLNLISEYLASATLATKSAIFIDSLEGKLQVIASSDGDTNIVFNKYVFENVRAIKEPILINDMTPLKLMPESNIMSQSVKAIICVPIIMSEINIGRTLEKEGRHKGGHLREQIKGYLYLESDRILNNFNKEGLERCIEVSKLVGCIIEKYQLQRSSSIDKLTGTYTRKYMEELLSYQIDLTEETNGKFSVIMLDLDHFKQVNDRYGHQTGDKVLKETCEIIRNSIREEDVCCRYGGEEFVVVLPEADSKEALNVAERIRIQVQEAKILGESTPVTISMGIATYPVHAQWKQELIEKADQALYVCKETGRNRCQVWSKEFSNKAKVTNKLAGIVSGNTVQDLRNVLAMVEIIELIKKDISTEEKIYNFLGRTIEITEAQYGMLFILKDENLQKKYTRKNYEEDWISGKSYNAEVLKSVIDKKQGVYMTDWDESDNFDIITGMPDWQSVVAVPLINSGQVKGVLYLTVSTNVKEFKFEDFNFINTLGELAASLV
jgi:diguanylate cyclase (GGDEF)-like protein